MLIQGSMPAWLKGVSDATRTKISESLRKALVLRAPRNRDELWAAVAYRWKMGVSRRAMCPDHDAPFDFIEFGFFQLYAMLFAMASKGGGKTLGFSMIHELNGGFKPGLWTAHVGSIEKQARRCWDYIEEHLKTEGLIGKQVDPLVYNVALDGAPLRSDIRWRTGSRLEILAGTLGQVSGPHPNVGAADEFELMTWEVWEHFSKTLQETEAGRAQMILGSTRFRLAGPVERVLNPEDGRKSPFKVVKWCVYESMAQCTYDCHNVPGFGQCPLWSRTEIKPDGTREEVPMCHGRAHDGDGHMSADAVITMFLMSPTMDDWATIMELRKPSKRGLFFPELEEDVHQSVDFEYVAGRPVYLGFDDGFHYPFCLGAWQMRPDGFLYQFDEIYGINRTTGDIIEDMRTRPWADDLVPAEDFGGWPDPSALQAIEAFNRWAVANRKDQKPLMRWDTDNNRIQGWKSLRGRLYGMTGHSSIGWHPRCVHTFADIKGLVQEEGKEDCKKVDDHGADQARYLVHNLDSRLGRRRVYDERHRPDGELEAIRRVNSAQAEELVRQRWDALIGSGRKESELQRLEANFPDDRDGFAKALGSLLAEHTLHGRLQRAGLRGDDDDEDRPGDEREDR